MLVSGAASMGWAELGSFVHFSSRPRLALERGRARRLRTVVCAFTAQRLADRGDRALVRGFGLCCLAANKRGERMSGVMRDSSPGRAAEVEPIYGVGRLPYPLVARVAPGGDWSRFGCVAYHAIRYTKT